MFVYLVSCDSNYSRTDFDSESSFYKSNEHVFQTLTDSILSYNWKKSEIKHLELISQHWSKNNKLFNNISKNLNLLGIKKIHVNWDTEFNKIISIEYFMGKKYDGAYKIKVYPNDTVSVNDYFSNKYAEFQLNRNTTIIFEQ